MSIIITSPLQKYFPALKASTSSLDWQKMIGDYLKKNQSHSKKLVELIDQNISILDHQKSRASLLIATLEEAGGLTIRARNLMSAADGLHKYADQIKDFENQFNAALVKFDTQSNESTFQGINLMTGGKLVTKFDDKGQHLLLTAGLDLNHVELGIRTPDFSTLFTLQNSRIDVMNAIDIVVTVRNTISAHISTLMISLDFANQSIELNQYGYSKLATSDLELETNTLKKLNELGAAILNGEDLANPAQQELLKNFTASPNMEEI